MIMRISQSIGSGRLVPRPIGLIGEVALDLVKGRALIRSRFEDSDVIDACRSAKR